jgi:hypothetical protein
MSHTSSLSAEGFVSILYGETFMHKKLSDEPNIQYLSSTDIRLRSLLDTIAAICLYEQRHQAFAVSISTSQTAGVTLYVSQNGTIPQFVVDHLVGIRVRLAQVSALSAKSAQCPADFEHRTTLHNAMADLEIALYLHSFEKLRHRFKKGVLDLFVNGEYQDIYPESVVNDPETTPKEHSIFRNMMAQLTELRDQMAMQVRPSYEDGKTIVQIINRLWDEWNPIMESNSRFLQRWDDIYGD